MRDQIIRQARNAATRFERRRAVFQSGGWERQVLLAGLNMASGLPAGDAELWTAAEERYGPKGPSIVEAARELLDVLGHPMPENSYAIVQAAFSTADGSQILQDFVNNTLAAPFAASDTTREWIREREVTNFLGERRTRLHQNTGMQKLPRGGSADHLTVKTTQETHSVARYATQWSVDEREFVDDGLEALTAPALAAGNAALALKHGLVYAKLLANPTMGDGTALFHADHNNLATGATLSASTLDAAIAAMLEQQEGGRPLEGFVPRVLLVPPALLGLGRRLVRDMALPADRGLTVQSDARLSLGATDPDTGTTYSGASDDWYLAAAPPSPTLEFSYIDSPRPTVRTWEMGGEGGVWGRGWSVKWDVGAGLLAFAGLYKAEA